MVVVNHTYKTMELYSKDVVGGGSGSYYAADNIFILGRQQEKEGTDIVGYNFIINVEKSRYVREKSKIPITVRHDGGISRWSGLLEMAIESGHVIMPSNGWYSRVSKETGEIESEKFRAAQCDSKEFWMPILTSASFQTWVKEKYQVANGAILNNEDIEKEYEDAER
jgi:hypothetical protein